MAACSRCGVSFHPEISACPLCGEIRQKERFRRKKLLYLLNSFAFTAVAGVVLLRVLTADDVQVGMSDSDCQEAMRLAESTRYAVTSLGSDYQRGVLELNEVSAAWANLANNYVPGKYSWSTSGREHNWLERLAQSTSNLASGQELNTENVANPSKYITDLTRLLPRFCS
jgi:predicted nucleic acid-binding Zn ribbon protein